MCELGMEIAAKLVYLQEAHIKLLNDKVDDLEVTLSHSRAEAKRLAENLRSMQESKGE